MKKITVYILLLLLLVAFAVAWMIKTIMIIHRLMN